MAIHRVLKDLFYAPFKAKDPKNAGTFRPTMWGQHLPIVTVGANETRNIPQPIAAGTLLGVMLVTDGGDAIVTVAGGYDYGANTELRLSDVGVPVWMMSYQSGTSFYWSLLNYQTYGGPVSGMWANCPSPANPAYHTLCHQYFNDFRALTYDYDATNEWTHTEVGAGGATAIVADGLCGTATMTTDALDNDAVQEVLNQMSFKAAAGKKIWFETGFKIVTAAKHIQSDWLVGLIGAGENLTAVGDILPVNGITIHKDDGDANIDLTTSDNNVDASSLAIGTALTTANTEYKLGFYFDAGTSGAAVVTPYVNGVAKTPITTCSYGTMSTLTPTFLYRNGEAGACVMALDYVKVVQLR